MKIRQGIAFGVHYGTTTSLNKFTLDSGDFEASVEGHSTVMAIWNTFRHRHALSAARIFAIRERGGRFLYDVIT
jgi:hypothetical protein